jgi:molybdenum cofactor synthesis domain-containing protein
MTVANTTESKIFVTAAVLVIGDEILSGRTKDKNIGYIAEYLTALGIDLKEVRVVADDEGEIVTAVNALRARYTYVFTTGGIGPTHDDITAECVAKAFGVAINHDPRAVAILSERLAKTGGEMNEARMRMTRIPAGADLVLNKVSAAPGLARQRDRDGGRALDHAGHARRGGAEAQDRRAHAVGNRTCRRARG